MNRLLIACSLIVFLGACAITHEPKLERPPEDLAKYQQDLKDCKKEADVRAAAADEKHKEHKMAGDIFGVAGVILSAPKYDPDDDYFKSLMQMTDECMLERGYPVVME